MIRVRLAARDGGHVVDVMMPPFRLMPEMVCWGERFFTLFETKTEADNPVAAEYREGLCYFVVPGTEVE